MGGFTLTNNTPGKKYTLTNEAPTLAELAEKIYRDDLNSSRRGMINTFLNNEGFRDQVASGGLDETLEKWGYKAVITRDDDGKATRVHLSDVVRKMSEEEVAKMLVAQEQAGG